MEYGMKALISWKMQFHVENVEVETMKSLTKLLLTNILPQHVATYYLEQEGEGVSCFDWMRRILIFDFGDMLLNFKSWSRISTQPVNSGSQN